ncbi:hypothetical protein SAMN02745687_02542 [Lachnospiraceae bacterium NK3A20]|nr:hypothetical protein SAMN02745687_02542 [Lachnospiraceae bacterium NK3A20]
MKRIFAMLLSVFLVISLLPTDVHADATVYVTKTGSKYHVDGCSSLSRSKIPMSLSEAESRGYEPCKKCKPWLTLGGTSSSTSAGAAIPIQETSHAVASNAAAQGRSVPAMPSTSSAGAAIPAGFVQNTFATMTYRVPVEWTREDETDETGVNYIWYYPYGEDNTDLGTVMLMEAGDATAAQTNDPAFYQSVIANLGTDQILSQTALPMNGGMGMAFDVVSVLDDGTCLEELIYVLPNTSDGCVVSFIEVGALSPEMRTFADQFIGAITFE